MTNLRAYVRMRVVGKLQLNVRRLTMYRNFKLFSVFALLALLLSTGIGTAQSLSNAQQPPSVSIEVDGKTIPIESGKNVHPQTYDLLSRDPDFASREDIKWIFVDDMWVPLKQTEELALREAPILEKTPSPDPVRSIFLSVKSRLMSLPMVNAGHPGVTIACTTFRVLRVMIVTVPVTQCAPKVVP